MEFLAALWLPILLSAVFVFIASSVIHMVIPIHKSDCGKFPAEDGVRAALRATGVGPGQYMVPHPGSMKEMCSPEMLAKYKEGPVGTIILRPSGTPGMGKALVLWFLFTLFVSLFVAYIGHHALAAGTAYLAVFRLTGAVAMLAYAFSYFPDSIWKGLPWRITVKFIFDGTIYALVTAGTFGWLWPRG